MMKMGHVRFFVFAVLTFALLVGCSDDPTSPPDIPDSITINSSPDGFDFPWSLELPDGHFVTGLGDANFTEMPPGDYNLIWEHLAGWVDTPAESSQELSAGNSITFNGTYGDHVSGAPNGDILLSNFKIAYESNSAVAFLGMLSPDYRNIVLQSTFDDWEGSTNPLSELYFDYDATTAIHGNIFGGADGTNEVGIPIPPIDSITISVLDKDGIWGPVDESVEYFSGRGAYQARYNLLMHFNKPDASRFEVDQTIDVFVVQEDDGFWYLLGIRGMEYFMEKDPKAGTDNTSYDGVLSLYR